ncbi:helix-turn-helix domain-containing protein [Variovorax sp. HJSM1_2]|uniref:helix-turn-helix domain-containing protein n=1 Tax=Variovorax sp. HJSM1_2 TaxID=3366263 RepID=UPI003BD31780
MVKALNSSRNILAGTDSANVLPTSAISAPDPATKLFSGVEELEVIGARLRQLRESKGLSMKRLAGLSGVSVPALQRIEVGTSSTGLATALALCHGLDEPLEHLVGLPRRESRAQAFSHIALPACPSNTVDLTGALAAAHLQSRVVFIRVGASEMIASDVAVGALFAFVLKGTLRVMFADGESLTLHSGDSLHLCMPDGVEVKNLGLSDVELLCCVDTREREMLREGLSPDASDRPDNTPVGQRIKTLRTSRKTSLSELAARSGVSASTISKIENSQARPSLVQAIRLAEALEANLAFLAGGYRHRPQKRCTVRAGDRNSMPYPEFGFALEDLNGSFYANVLEARLGVLNPGAHSGQEHMVHAGDELCFVMEGAMRFRFDTESGVKTVDLSARECLQFKSTMPHSWVNTHGGPTTVLWVFSDGLSF